jgi:hypothetical protein
VEAELARALRALDLHVELCAGCRLRAWRAGRRPPCGQRPIAPLLEGLLRCTCPRPPGPEDLEVCDVCGGGARHPRRVPESGPARPLEPCAGQGRLSSRRQRTRSRPSSSSAPGRPADNRGGDAGGCDPCRVR